jgi:hypothetical protein
MRDAQKERYRIGSNFGAPIEAGEIKTENKSERQPAMKDGV